MASYCVSVLPYGNRPLQFQWARPDYESGGQEFESLRARHFSSTERPMSMLRWSGESPRSSRQDGGRKVPGATDIVREINASGELRVSLAQIATLPYKKEHYVIPSNRLPGFRHRRGARGH